MVGLCYLRLSFLLTVKIWFCLFYLRLNYGLVFFAYGGKSVWSFLLTVLLVQGIGFGLFYLRFPYRKLKRRTVSKKTSTVSKKDASVFFLQILGTDFGRTDFSRIFVFEPPDFFADFVAGFFLLIFVGKVPRKILQQNPRQNPPKPIQQKSPTTFCRGAGTTDFRGSRNLQHLGGAVFRRKTQNFAETRLSHLGSRTLKSTLIRGVPTSEFSGIQRTRDKGGGREGGSGGRVNRA